VTNRRRQVAKTTMFERSRMRVRFANEDMDYLF
jgi:hypothetical protein